MGGQQGQEGQGGQQEPRDVAANAGKKVQKGVKVGMLIARACGGDVSAIVQLCIMVAMFVLPYLIMGAMAMVLIIVYTFDQAIPSGANFAPSQIEGIPAEALTAYTQAAANAPQVAPNCNPPWWLLAGIGAKESGHGRGNIQPNGDVVPMVLGPPLNGSGAGGNRTPYPNTLSPEEQRIYGVTGPWLQAVGPMQFMPGTWKAYGKDGNNDGVASPHNYFDVTLSAAVYLCANSGGGDLTDEASQRRALFRYNNSSAYVEAVMTQAHQYRELGEAAKGKGIGLGIRGTGNTVTVQGIVVDSSIAGQVDAMLTAARADGVALSGGGWRSPDEQIRLRMKHCGTSHYAIYEMSASACTPDTARPGSSMHERGLAIDFSNCPHGSSCFNWLSGNAARFGFYNLPSESWHWSVNGN